MQRITLFLGGSDTQIEKVIQRFLFTFGGVTVTKGRGLWTDPDGTVYDEPSYVIDLLVRGSVTEYDLHFFDRIITEETTEKAYALSVSSGDSEIRTPSR